MVTTIKVLIKFDHEPSLEYLDNYVDQMISVVDDYCNHKPRSFHLEEPKPEQIATKDFIYRWVIDVCDASAHAKDLFKLIKDIACAGELLLVNVLDHDYDIAHKNEKGYYWTNDGETWYHDSKRGYIDPYYDFHVNDYQDYSIIHIPSYLHNNDNMYPRDRQYYEESGATFMWKCTACWNNFMKATNIEEAIEEFEEMYREKLWQAVESVSERLNSTTKSFRDFDTYRRNKKG